MAKKYVTIYVEESFRDKLVKLGKKVGKSPYQLLKELWERKLTK
jgi:hypothetical protein